MLLGQPSLSLAALLASQLEFSEELLTLIHASPSYSQSPYADSLGHRAIPTKI